MKAAQSAQPDEIVAMLDVAHRAAPLRVHVWPPSIPAAGPVPVVLFSHGAGLTGGCYAPLFRLWASQGLAMLAPDHEPDETPAWLARVRDMHAVWHGCEHLAAGLPALVGRLHGAPRVAGHSFGGHTASILLGARPRIALPADEPLRLDQAVSGVLLAPPGDGGPDNLTTEWLARAPHLQMDWSGLDRPVMVLVGRLDRSPMSVRDWRWHADAFFGARPGRKLLRVLPQGDHYLGGIATGRGHADPDLLHRVAEASGHHLARRPNRQGRGAAPNPAGA